MPRDTLFMETTGIAPQKTCGDIVELLVKAGATQVNMQYDKGKIKGLRWCFRMGIIYLTTPQRKYDFW